MIVTLSSQLITSLCNFFLTGILISTFGSVLYGITSSVNQFLSCVSLLEGGVGRVGRAEMYRPLAQEDDYGVSRVYHAMKRFFTGVGIICIAYILILSLAYYDIAAITGYSRKYIFALVWILGITTLSKYLGGLTNQCLLVADQKQYISNGVIAVSTLMGVALALVFVYTGADLLYVKLIISLAYAARPIAYGLYVKKHYRMPKVGKDYSPLEQKWSGMGQNIAFFLHTNTDIVLLTLFADLRLVAVYSVYTLVLSNIRLITITFSSGMEGALGEVYSSGDQTLLRRTYERYQFVMFFVVFVLFGTTAVLILPFVKLYTQHVTDVNYIQPVFGAVFMLAEASECMMYPCCTLAVSANRIRETRWAYYGEVIINLTISVLLIRWNPLLGLVLGTFVAVTVKNLVFAVYAAVNILKVNVLVLVKPMVLIYGAVLAASGIGWMLWSAERIHNYFQWIAWGVAVVICMAMAAAAASLVFYNRETRAYLKNVLQKNGEKSHPHFRRKNAHQ